MSYVRASLGKDENLEHSFSFHWVIKLQVVSAYIASLVLVIVLFSASGLLSLFIGLAPIVFHLQVRTTEQAVTNKRVIFKKGIISRYTEEQLLNKIETIEVGQSIFGRMLGYGNVKITGTGRSEVVFKDIDDPLDVKRKIEDLLLF